MHVYIYASHISCWEYYNFVFLKNYINITISTSFKYRIILSDISWSTVAGWVNFCFISDNYNQHWKQIYKYKYKQVLQKMLGLYGHIHITIKQWWFLYLSPQTPVPSPYMISCHLTRHVERKVNILQKWMFI